MKAIIVSNDGCKHCGQVKEIFKKLKSEYKGLEVEEVSTTSPKGIDLISKYQIMASPGVIINNQLAFMGGASEHDIRKKLNESSQTR